MISRHNSGVVYSDIVVAAGINEARFENISPGWQTRETYQILGPDKFVEIFELAVPDKDFENYPEGHFQRVHAE